MNLRLTCLEVSLEVDASFPDYYKVQYTASSD